MIHMTISKLVFDGLLKEPFRVSDVKKVSKILDKSPSFLSKHRIGNPAGNRACFERVGRGLYKIL